MRGSAGVRDRDLQSSRLISEVLVRAGLIAMCMAAPGVIGSAFASSFASIQLKSI
jgi:hypothetical protein